MKKRDLIPIPRTTLATYVMCTFVILAAFAIGILTINSRVNDRADASQKTQLRVALCILREFDKSAVRGALSSVQLSKGQGNDLLIPDDLLPKLPLPDKSDPCDGLLQDAHIDVDELLRELCATQPSASSCVAATTSPATVVPAGGTEVAKIHSSLSSPARRTTTTTTRRSPSTSTGTRPPTTAPTTRCTYPVPALCGVAP